MRNVVSPHLVLDREIAPFATALLAAAAPAAAPIAEQRRHAAELRQRWTIGGPVMRRRRDGIADTARGLDRERSRQESRLRSILGAKTKSRADECG